MELKRLVYCRYTKYEVHKFWAKAKKTQHIPIVYYDDNDTYMNYTYVLYIYFIVQTPIHV